MMFLRYMIQCVVIITFYLIFRERVCAPISETADENKDFEKRVATTLESPPTSDKGIAENGPSKPNHSARSLLKSASISASKCIGVKQGNDVEVNFIATHISCSLYIFPLPPIGAFDGPLCIFTCDSVFMYIYVCTCLMNQTQNSNTPLYEFGFS